MEHKYFDPNQGFGKSGMWAGNLRKNINNWRMLPLVRKPIKEHN